MPNIIDRKDGLQDFTGTITHMFKGCPKASGWFGCYFRIDGESNDVAIKGTYTSTNVSDIHEDVRLHIMGRLNHSDTYGDSYVCTYISLIPDKKDVLKIIATLNGIGKVTIDALRSNFGDDLYDIIRNEPDRLQNIGINDKKIKILQDGITDTLNMYRIKILKIAPNLSQKKVDAILDVSNKEPEASCRLFEEVAKKNPWGLIRKFDSISFSDADDIALNNGFQIDSEERIIAGMEYCLKTDYRDCVCIKLEDEFSSYVQNVIRILSRAESAQTLSADYLEDKISDMLYGNNDLPVGFVLENDWLYESSRYDAEIYTAEKMSELVLSDSIFEMDHDYIMNEIEAFEKLKSIKLDSDQKHAVECALSYRVSVITGGPGCGKSSVANCIAWIYERYADMKGSGKDIILCAPTGKACRRLSEACEGRETKTAMKYIVLENVLFDNDSKEAKKIKYQWEKNLIIIDETTMVGLGVMKNLLQMFETCQIVFMGDVNQLPSIDYGQFFKDICKWDPIEKIILKNNHRSVGSIVSNANLMLDGTHIENTKLDVNDEFTFYNDGDSQEICHNTIIAKYFNAVNDKTLKARQMKMKNISILCPMNKGLAGVFYLNMALQEMLNKRGKIVTGLKYKRKDLGECEMRVGDRVMFTKNIGDVEYVYRDKNGKVQSGLGINNGDIGFITDFSYDVDMGQYYVRFETDDGIIYSMPVRDCIDNMDLAYAMTIHKAQGSEYDKIILALSSDMYYTRGDFGSRNLVYTAITRAKKSCMMIGSVGAMNRCIDTLLQPRNSNLNIRMDFAYNNAEAEY